MQRKFPQARIVHFTLAEYVDAVEYMRSGRRPLKENNGNLPGWGYRLGMSDREAFNLNRWDWNLELERNPKFVIFSWDGIVRLAAKITRIRPIPASVTKKKEILGRVLEDHEPLYVQYVKKETPEWAKGRNPRYLNE